MDIETDAWYGESGASHKGIQTMSDTTTYQGHSITVRQKDDGRWIASIGDINRITVAYATSALALNEAQAYIRVVVPPRN